MCYLRVLIFGLAVSLTAGVSGCRDGRWAGRGAGEPEQTSPADAADLTGIPAGSHARSSGPAGTVVQIHFDVMRVELPLDSVRHSAKIWNHVDELRVDPRQSALLSRNGIRIGVTRADAWPAIHAILEAQGGRAVRRQHAVQSGYPLTLDVGDSVDGETIFTYDGQGNLEGQTFGAGHKYVHIDYVVSGDDPPRIALRVTPEVNVQSDDRRWQAEDGEILEKPRYEGHVYSDLAVGLTLSPGQILVLGADAEAGTRLLLGNRFFDRFEGGQRYEILYFATPQLFRSGSSR